MNRQQLVSQILFKKNYLCVGLDTDETKLPQHLSGRPDAVLEFNKAIIDATKDFCVSYKLNTAFYEAMGVKGWDILEKTVQYIPDTHFKIADAKRGDIGNTSSQYAKAFFDVYGFDAVTVAPYMGEDSIRPFLEYDNKFTIVLGLTSNKGSADFEQLAVVDNNQTVPLYKKVMSKVSQWGTPQNLMFVIGATHPQQLEEIRRDYSDFFFLVPGVGAQGGNLQEVSKAAITADGGLLINASRAIIYAASSEDFDVEAGVVSRQYALEMSEFIG